QAKETALAYPAIRLFVERAASARAGFALGSREEVGAVGRICARLDGIPLAIELAAARIRTLTPAQIAERMDDRFRLLTTGARGAMPRHQTLHALIDWSYDQLPEPERVLLRRLSVFAGGWTLEAAEAVCAGRDEGWGMRDESGQEPDRTHPSSLILHQSEVLDLLDSLVDRSLGVAEEQGDGLRYRMLETVREYALERLRDPPEGGSPEEQSVRARHADYYLDLARQACPFVEKLDAAWLDRLELEHDNLRGALTFFAAQKETIDKAVQLGAG